MNSMNNLAINENIFEQFKDSAEKLEYKELVIDIKDDMQEYVETLKIEEEHLRENHLKQWIKNKATPFITVWERKYAGGDQILNNIYTEMDKLRNIENTEQININNLQNQITSELGNKERKEKEINTSNQNEVGNKKIDIVYEKKKSLIFIIFSIIIAISTYLYFMTTQIDLKWATMTKNDQVTVVKDMIIQTKSTSLYNTFIDEIPVDDNERKIPLDKLTEQDLTAITIDNIHKVNSLKLSEAISYDTTYLIYGAFAFALILLGKATATVYEKLKYPNWMFYSLWGLAFIVIVSAVYVNASLAEKQLDKVSISNEINTINAEKIRIEKNNKGFGFSLGNNTDKTKSSEVLELEKKLSEAKDKLKEKNIEMGSFKSLTLILVMLSEIIIGSIAWIVYAEYIEKKNRIENGGQGHIKALKNELIEIENKINKLYEDIEEKSNKITLANELKSKLASLEGDIHSKAQIHNIANQYLEQLIADGMMFLRKAKLEWNNKV